MIMKKEKLISKLNSISKKFQNLENELNEIQAWNFLCLNFNGHPLKNIDEMLASKDALKELFQFVGIELTEDTKTLTKSCPNCGADVTTTSADNDSIRSCKECR